MTAPSSTAVILKERRVSIFRVILLAISMTLILVMLWTYGSFKSDPFIKKTLAIEGDKSSGSRLFKINCVGCHGISAQGLVGPDLHEVTNRLSDQKIVNQVVKGLTPPMPSFEIDSQSMADLLEYMHSLN